jgi:16S rRNA (cytosine1402-N4)-methyltransferase
MPSEVTPEVSPSETTEHRPVLAHPLIESLQPREGATVVDGTLGAGGITALLSQSVGDSGRVIAIDRDGDAVERARGRFSSAGNVTLVQGNFADLTEILEKLGIEAVDAVALDLGISSTQLDDGRRGFSFRHDGPLDMRMDQTDDSLTAAKIVNQWSEEDIVEILRNYADERFARRIATEIIRRRRIELLTTTFQLRDCVERAVPSAMLHRRLHPATKTFQALRIAVNDELRNLESGLQATINALRPGGRLGVISFHSLEDTLVKVTLNVSATSCICPPQQPVCTCAHRASLHLLSRRAIKPDPAELSSNPRSRSARLRVAEKL